MRPRWCAWQMTSAMRERRPRSADQCLARHCRDDGARHPLAPPLGFEQLGILLIGDVAELEQDRGYLCAFDHHEGRRAVGVVLETGALAHELDHGLDKHTRAIA